MPYEVIARKWRPQTFREIVGQEAIAQTLRNAVEQERLHHAYLFTGARGVGKTTTARILAKALNCMKGVTPDPCGLCPSCVEIASGGSLDVIEIDAASHTGVDNIRDVIISSVGIAPARDRYKVFIVDEVHQLSTAAFNAMLKTLEEPPPRVVFVLATTELHKVPDTITSRCQLFEFRSIPLAKIQAKLGEIARKMNVEITDAALAALARAGEGSMRDAQSALDQAIAFAGEKVDVPEVVAALGVVGDETLYILLEAIADGDGGNVLRLCAPLVEAGHDLRHFARAMMRAVRNLLVVRAVGYDPELVDATEADAPRVQKLAGRFSESELVRMFSLLTQLEQEIRQSSEPRFQLEMGMVRLAELPRLRPLDEIIDRLERLEARVAGSGGGSAPPVPEGQPPPARPTRSTRKSSPSESSPPAKASGGPPPPRPLPDDEPEVLYAELPDESRPRPTLASQIKEAVEKHGKKVLAATLDLAPEMVVDGDRLVIRFGKSSQGACGVVESNRATVEGAVQEVIGRRLEIVVVASDDPAAGRAASEAGPATSARKAAAVDAASDPIVKAVVETFKGQLVDVKEPQSDA